jgi:hypothetical protein
VPVCGARLRGQTADRRCQQRAMHNGRCRLHGGKSLGGVASPRFKHGRHSKFRPVRLLDKMDATTATVADLGMRNEIAVVSKWINDAIEQVHFPGSPMAGLVNTLQDAHRAGDQSAMDALLERYGEPGGAMPEHAAAWSHLRNLIRMRQCLIRIETGQRTAIRSPMIQMLVAGIYDSLRRHVTDRSVLSAIHRDITALLTYEV